MPMSVIDLQAISTTAIGTTPQPGRSGEVYLPWRPVTLAGTRRWSAGGGAEPAHPGGKQAGVAAAEGEQVVVGPHLGEAPVVDHGDPVGPRRGREPVAITTTVRPSINRTMAC